MSRKKKRKSAEEFVENEIVEDAEVSSLAENIIETDSDQPQEDAEIAATEEDDVKNRSVTEVLKSMSSDEEESTEETGVDSSGEEESVEEVKPSFFARLFSVFKTEEDIFADVEEESESVETEEVSEEEEVLENAQITDDISELVKSDEEEFFSSEEDVEEKPKRKFFFFVRSKKVDDSVVEEVDTDTVTDEPEIVETEEISNDEKESIIADSEDKTSEEDLEYEYVESQVPTLKESIKAFKENLSSLHIIFAIGILVFLSIASLGAISLYKSYKYNKGIHASEKKGAVAWVNAFTGHGYDVCDSMVKNEQDRVLSNKVYFNFSDSDYYTIAVNALSDSIQGVELKTITNLGSKKVYTFDVTVKVFEPIDSIKVYNFDEVKEEYISNTIGRESVTTSLYGVYKNTYKENCFNFSEDTKVITLELVEDDNYVENTVNFIKTLYIQTGLNGNIIKFDEDIKSAVDDCILEVE